MKPSDLMKLLQRLNLTRAAFAESIGRNERTIRRWLAGQTPIPSWVERVMDK